MSYWCCSQTDREGGEAPDDQLLHRPPARCSAAGGCCRTRWRACDANQRPRPCCRCPPSPTCCADSGSSPRSGWGWGESRRRSAHCCPGLPPVRCCRGPTCPRRCRRRVRRRCCRRRSHTPGGVGSGIADRDGDVARPYRVCLASRPSPTDTLPGVLVQPAPMPWPLSEAQEALADPALLSAAPMAAARLRRPEPL